ncbi:MAG: BamA/TamA family outer membrane protein [Chitinophagales bacterium]|nr:BamA/TamA family outer membrane protein [Chitinophagales bacterium]MDW8427620.1 BamA/TamA family outer membrane protein [Chitinophagales bacterium]
MSNAFARYLVFASLLAAVCSCAPTRRVPPGARLLNRIEVNLETQSRTGTMLRRLNETMSMENKLASLARQKPNRKMLGIFRFNLFVYNLTYTNKQKGIRAFLMNRLGEPPVLFDSTQAITSAALMASYLRNKGFLFPSVSYTWQAPRFSLRKVNLTYYARTGPLYRIDSLIFPYDSSALNQLVWYSRHKTTLSIGDAFDTDLLSAEQARILREFQNNGYYHFKKEYIRFVADTSIGNHGVHVYITLSIGDSAAAHSYRISRVTVYPDYDARFELRKTTFDTTDLMGFRFLEAGQFIHLPVVAEAIFLRPGALYSRLDYECSLNRLADLNVYKFASARFIEADSNRLDAVFLLQPARKHQVSAELDVGNVENSLATGIRLSLLSRNVARRANRIDLSGLAGIQVPVVRPDSLFYNFSVQLRYAMPRFAVPFIHPIISCYNNPLTTITLNASLYEQTGYYTLRNLGAGYSLEWKEVDFPLKRYVLPLFRFTYVYPTYSAAFGQRLQQDAFLKASFSEQFINSVGGAFVFSNQRPKEQRNFIYLRVEAETAGNLPFLTSRLVLRQPLPADGSFSIFGVDYSQYVRLSTDVRRYWHFNYGRQLVGRLAGGIGYAYGNARVMPYVKQFQVGGTSSMRGWRIRSLGPGSYVDTTFSYSSTGDIMLEGNIEYRFPVAGPLRTAFFVDAGNVWLMRADSLKAEGVFYFKNFYKQIALSTGVGIRFDFTYFILRFDLATPAYAPGAPEGQRWRLKYFYVFRNGRLNRDINLQLAIGYPF